MLLLVWMGSDEETTELPVHFHLELVEELGSARRHSVKYGEPCAVLADWGADVGWVWEARTFKDFEEFQVGAAEAKEEALGATPSRPVSPST
jgi:hypothetical protein